MEDRKVEYKYYISRKGQRDGRKGMGGCWQKCKMNDKYICYMKPITLHANLKL